MKEVLATIAEHITKLFNWYVIVAPWEQGVRVRFGKKIKHLYPGIYFRIPYFDAVFVQTTRTRVVTLTMQTITTTDGYAISINASCRYRIDDVFKLFNTLYHPDATIANIVLGEIGKYISSREKKDCPPEKIESEVSQTLGTLGLEYGISDTNVGIISFAVVTTYRMINDQCWQPITSNVDNDSKR